MVKLNFVVKPSKWVLQLQLTGIRKRVWCNVIMLEFTRNKEYTKKCIQDLQNDTHHLIAYIKIEFRGAPFSKLDE